MLMGKVTVTFGRWVGQLFWQERGWGEALMPDPVSELSVAL